VARWTKDGLPQATSVLEAALWHYAIKVTCRCGHAATFNPHGLWWHFEQRGWDDKLRLIQPRFWCRACHTQARRKVRPIRIDLIKEMAGDIELPYPPADVWKRTLRRIRT
jgi:hypothetical protein